MTQFWQRDWVLSSKQKFYKPVQECCPYFLIFIHLCRLNNKGRISSLSLWPPHSFISLLLWFFLFRISTTRKRDLKETFCGHCLNVFCFFYFLLIQTPNSTVFQAADVFHSCIHTCCLWFHLGSSKLMHSHRFLRRVGRDELYDYRRWKCLSKLSDLSLFSLLRCSVFTLQAMCASLRNENTSRLSEMSPNPTEWLSVTRLNLCLCLEYRLGSLVCHSRKDYKRPAQPRQMYEMLFFFLHCSSFSSAID